MQERIQDLIPVGGNRYFTPYGLYTCKVKDSETQGCDIKVKIVLVRECDGSQPARVYKITGTCQAMKKKRLSLVIDIHKWALLDRDADGYWVKKVQI